MIIVVTTMILMIILLTMVMTRATTGHKSNRGQIRTPSWNIEIHNAPLLSNLLKGFKNFLEIFPIRKYIYNSCASSNADSHLLKVWPKSKNVGPKEEI